MLVEDIALKTPLMHVMHVKAGNVMAFSRALNGQ